MWLLRPIIAEPPLCSLSEAKTILTIDDLADLHEILDVKERMAAKAAEQTGRPKR